MKFSSIVTLLLSLAVSSAANQGLRRETERRMGSGDDTHALSRTYDAEMMEFAEEYRKKAEQLKEQLEKENKEFLELQENGGKELEDLRKKEHELVKKVEEATKKLREEEKDEQEELEDLIEVQQELATLEELRKQAEANRDKKKMRDLEDDILKLELGDLASQTLKWQQAVDETEKMRKNLANIVADLKVVRMKIVQVTFEYKPQG